jgi:formate dehydrogenase major subunit
VSWSLDLSGGIQRVAIKHGCVPYGNAKARMNAWNLPDPVPVHREPIYTSTPGPRRPYPTFRTPAVPRTQYRFLRAEGRRRQRHRQAFPLILTSGRLVEYEGGGEETRSNKWLAELQQDMFVEINPADAAERGIKDGGWVWVTGAEALKDPYEGAGDRARRQGRGLDAVHFAGWFEGVDLRAKYPKGADPIVLGESANTLTTYGYDPATGMQEPNHAVPDPSGVREAAHGAHEIPLRRRPLHRLQRLRHRLQERERGAVGHQPAARRHHQ